MVNKTEQKLDNVSLAFTRVPYEMQEKQYAVVTKKQKCFCNIFVCVSKFKENDVRKRSESKREGRQKEKERESILSVLLLITLLSTR